MDSSSLSYLDTEALLELLSRADGRRPELEAEVVRRHQWMIEGLTRSYVQRGIDKALFERLASAALQKAVRSYDQDSGEFVAFAMIAVITEMRRLLRRESDRMLESTDRHDERGVSAG